MIARLPLGILLALLASPATAALSPFYDSIVERIETILQSSAVADALHQAPIGMISNTGTRADGASEWAITTQQCDLVIYLVALPPNVLGKTTYELELPGVCD